MTLAPKMKPTPGQGEGAAAEDGMGHHPGHRGHSGHSGYWLRSAQLHLLTTLTQHLN